MGSSFTPFFILKFLFFQVAQNQLSLYMTYPHTFGDYKFTPTPSLLAMPKPPLLIHSLPFFSSLPLPHKTEHSVPIQKSKASVFPLPLLVLALRFEQLKLRMAAIVCHGLQSCLESQLVESRTLRLSLPFSKPLNSQPIDLAFKTSFWDSNSKTHCEEIYNKTETLHDNHSSSNPNMSGWSFLQALSNVSQGPKEPLEKESIYVHPQVKRSSLLLSPKSLELCTENLGNETGTDIIENNIDLLSALDCAGGNSPTREQTKPRQVLGARKARAQNFPPPLTTIRGSESLRVRPHREDGRLVIEAFKVPSSASCFHAERSHGRLRLCFLKDCTPSFDPEEAARENNEPMNEGVDEEYENEKIEETEQVEEEAEEDKQGEEEDGEETEEEEDDVKDGEGDACGCEENNGADMRMEKYERPSRCKEGDHENNELLNWGEPLWVAIS